MRKNKVGSQQNEFKILALDDDPIMTVTLQSYFQTSGYLVDIENNPEKAIERIKEDSYDILLLDFLMTPICGDEVVRQIRQFNDELYIILLTGHKSLAPPIKTIRELDIQGYYEKSDRFDQLELLVESCVKSIAQMRTIRSYQDGLRQLVDGMPDIYRIQPLEELATKVLKFLEHMTAASSGYLYVDTRAIGRQMEEYGQALGVERQYFGQPVCEEQAAAEFAQAAEAYEQNKAASVMIGQRLIVPLVSVDNQPFGSLGFVLEKNAPGNVAQLAEVYARQVTAALSNVFLHMVLAQKNEEVRQAYASLRDSYLEIIRAMRLVVDAKDIYTRGHSDRVSEYSQRIAQAMGKDADFVERVRVAGLFHDVGKIGISDSILLKTSRLTPEEYEQIKQHPTKGKEILTALSAFRSTTDIVEQHHEWYNGGGYPKGLRGEEILEEARVICIADAFDAMTSHRLYCNNLDLAAAEQQLMEGKGTQFDARIVDVFLEILKDFDEIQKDLAWTYHVNS